MNLLYIKEKVQEPNTYLAKLFLYNEKNEINYNKLKELSEEEYFKYIINLFKGAVQLLDSMSIEDKEFSSLQKKKMHYDLLYKLLNHSKTEVFLAKSDSSVISDYLMNEFNEIDLDDSLAFYNDRNYKFLVLSYYNYGLISNHNDVLENYKNSKKLIYKRSCIEGFRS